MAPLETVLLCIRLQLSPCLLVQVYVVGSFADQLNFQSHTSVTSAQMRNVTGSNTTTAGYLAAFSSSTGETLWTKQYAGQAAQVTTCTLEVQLHGRGIGRALQSATWHRTFAAGGNLCRLMYVLRSRIRTCPGCAAAEEEPDCYYCQPTGAKLGCELIEQSGNTVFKQAGFEAFSWHLCISV